MGIVSALASFIIIWWLSLFLVLPFAIKRDETGKPDDPKMNEKFILTSLLSIVLWSLFYVIIQMGLIDFFAIAEAMMSHDMDGEI